MSKHVSALGFLYTLFGLFTAFLGVVVLVIGLGSIGGFLREILDIIGYGHLARWLGAGFGGALLGAGVLSLATAYGLFARKSWGRLLAMLGGLSQVVTFSWPALLGVYGFWVLLSEEGAREFKRRR